MRIMLSRLFPTPDYLAIPAVGIDFSDATMRFIELRETLLGIVPVRFAALAIPDGVLQSGRIADEGRFIEFLKEAKRIHNLSYVRVAIPESQTYSFTVSLDGAAATDIRGAISLILEDNIPLKAAEAIFDYHILQSNERTIVVQVVAMSQTTSESYYRTLASAALIPVGFELDGQAIARAVLRPVDTGSNMIVDFGARRTSIIIVTNGTTVFTSTIDFGGKQLLGVLSKDLGISLEEAEQFKFKYGLSSMSERPDIFTAMTSGIATLKDEINRSYVYWHEKKSQLGVFPPINTIYLSGGHSNLRGLVDYLRATLKLSVVQANPWVNCVSFDHVIPSMTAETAMSYVTAIGLVLADYSLEHHD